MQADFDIHRRSMRRESAIAETLQIAWRQFIDRPIAALLTMIGLAVVLVLPLGAFWLLSNASNMPQSWEHSSKVTIFLKENVTTSQAESFLNQVVQRNDVAKAVYISPDQGLKDLIAETKVNMTDKLPNNPLPSVIEVLLKGIPSPEQVAKFEDSFKVSSVIEEVKLNKEALTQPYRKLQFAWQQFNFFVGLFVLVAVVMLANYLQFGFRDSFGALYINGAFYGLAAGLAAWVLLTVVSSYLGDTVQTWLGQPNSLSNDVIGKFLLLSVSMGLVSAVVATALLFVHPLSFEAENEA